MCCSCTNMLQHTLRSLYTQVDMSTAAALEIESEDVLRLIMQYLKEHNLAASLKQLQSESKVCLDTVDNLEALSSDINHGRWEVVLLQVIFPLMQLEVLLVVRYSEVIEITMPSHVLSQGADFFT